MDNRIFNVNGKGAEHLMDALNLVFNQNGEKTVARGWSETKTHGLILHWCEDEGQNKLPGLSAADALPFVLAWLRSEFAKEVIREGWDGDSDHDGHNSSGWRVYCEDWGHVNNRSNAICGIRPVYLWHGK